MEWPLRMSNHILIIDGDEAVREDLSRHLKTQGYQVSTSGTGEGGLEIVERETVDLVILDLNLPDGDGLSIEQKVREDHAVPIIIATARSDQEDKLMALSLGATEYLTKPVDEKELLLRVRNIIGLVHHGDGAATPSPRQEADEQAIKKSISLRVKDFLEHARTGPANAPERGRRSVVVGIAVTLLVLVVLIGGGAYWFFTGGTEFDYAQPLPTAESPAPAQKPPQKTLPEEKPVAAVEIPAEQRARPEVKNGNGYEWALATKCGPLPDVEWWLNKTHIGIAAYVDQKHGGDWATYMDQWYQRVLKLQDIFIRGSGARTSSGVLLKGPALRDYLAAMTIRLNVIRCLAKEAEDHAPG